LCIGIRNRGRPRLPQDALASRPDPLDPIRKRLHEVLQKFACTIVDELAMFIERLVGMADIGFGLLHGRQVQKHQRLPEMMIGTEGRRRRVGLQILIEKGQLPDLDNVELIKNGASEISAFASFPFNEAFRRLPTSTPTLIGLSMAIPMQSLETCRSW
jgi:hypothetical protein